MAIHYEAMAFELAARALRRRGELRVASSYLAAAREGYLRWGALGKVRALADEHPELAAPKLPEQLPAMSLDMIGAARASQALSSETSPSALHEQILRVIVQTSGARRATFLVDQEGVLRVEGHLDTQVGAVQLGSAGPLESASLVSETIVRHTLRTGQDVMLTNAREVGPFTRDPYVLRHGSRSLLCMAVRHQDRITGVLFLENELTSGIFTAERLSCCGSWRCRPPSRWRMPACSRQRRS